ncbi:MAG: XkdX family protein [Clostridia bacterium]|nr:XkdX family protein [Clostridia bacterium]
MSRHFETIRRYYRKGLYSCESIETLRLRGAITAEEAELILSEKPQD